MAGLSLGVLRRLHSDCGCGDSRAIGLELAVRPDVPARVTAEVIDVAVAADTFELPPWLIADRTNIVRHRGYLSFSVSEGANPDTRNGPKIVNSVCHLRHTKVCRQRREVNQIVAIYAPPFESRARTNRWTACSTRRYTAAKGVMKIR